MINAEKGKSKTNMDIHPLKINNNIIMNQCFIAKTFNNYFL
jgi:hypothetical protein